MDTGLCETEAGPCSFFALVEHLTLQYSAENTKLSQLISTALACASFKTLESEVVQRLWYVALSVSDIRRIVTSAKLSHNLSIFKGTSLAAQQ